MKATELRIGNYLYYEATTHVVSGILGNRVYSWWVKDGKAVIEYETKDVGGAQVENPYIDNINRYEPIPLTEEWLLKFGFKSKSYGYGDSEWKQWNNGKITLNGFRETLSGVDCEYIHQLQNLYFALTGEELEIKL